MAKAQADLKIVDVKQLIQKTTLLLKNMKATPILTKATLAPDGLALSGKALEDILAKNTNHNSQITNNINLLFKVGEFKIGAQLMEQVKPPMVAA